MSQAFEKYPVWMVFSSLELFGFHNLRLDLLDAPYGLKLLRSTTFAFDVVSHLGSMATGTAQAQLASG